MKLTEQAAAAWQWWWALQPDSPDGRSGGQGGRRSSDPTRRRPGDRAALARLRRCTSLVQAAVEPAALDLARRVGVRDGSDPHLADALLAAVVLSHVRKDDPGVPAARRLGAPAPGQAAPMSPMRLARLLAADTFEERLLAFRRAVSLAGHEINVRDLAFALLDWSDACRVRWAFAYHDAPAPRPADEVPATEAADTDAPNT